MNYDTHNCPDGKELFERWIIKEICPFSNSKMQRCINFTESINPYKPLKTPKLALELAIALIQEKCKNSDYHK